MAEAEREAEEQKMFDGLEAFMKTQEFAGRDANLIKELILNASIETFVDDQVIFREHDDVDRIYFIQHGEAAVCVDDQPIEKISSGKVIGMGAIFESLGLPVTIKAMAACNMRTVTKQNFLSALQKYPEEASHLRTFAERLCKEETTRWEKRSAILRTKRKLKAISAMRGGRKHLAPKDDTFDRQASSMSGVSETPVSPGRPLQDEATRRAKVQAIRAQMQARARGAPGEVPAPAAPPSSPDPGRRARTRTQSGVGVAEKTTSQDEVRPCGPGALSQSPEDSLMEVDDLNTLEQISPAATTMEDSGLARQQSTGSETMITASSGTREGHRVRRQHSAGTRGKEEGKVERRSMKRSFLPVVPGAKPSEGA
ncbi:Potassium/sodium hyperpolarization-activated cyclic nucleotide-gated channel 4 [Durusdinium trenchii]|uniref:Potassium/sodium hyperpolarization-activated cyclic nucleotide-gated channel 4 n=1 Tax=Durusdinium trenchii TaxID=1381693 RepID=A0ABP0S505_9DINO